jgi:hypothetical protein
MAFAYYEVVKIRSTPGTIRDGIAELEGAVLGVSEEKGEIVSYAVSVYEREGVCWSLTPSDLEATGRHDRRETFYDETSIRVSQTGELLDPDDGRA